jgi:hypothetical protein
VCFLYSSYVCCLVRYMSVCPVSGAVQSVCSNHMEQNFSDCRVARCSNQLPWCEDLVASLTIASRSRASHLLWNSSVHEAKPCSNGPPSVPILIPALQSTSLRPFALRRTLHILPPTHSFSRAVQHFGRCNHGRKLVGARVGRGVQMPLQYFF